MVCAVNCHVLGKALTLAKTLGASVQFKLMSAIDETQSLVLSEAQRDGLFAERAQLESIGASANLDTFYTELSGSAPDRFPIDEVGCFAGHWYARVDGDANVRFCCNPNSELTLGNLHETSFTDLWRSQAWHALRTRLRSGDFLPGCERCGKFDLNVQTRRRLEQSQGALRIKRYAGKKAALLLGTSSETEVWSSQNLYEASSCLDGLGRSSTAGSRSAK